MKKIFSALMKKSDTEQTEAVHAPTPHSMVSRKYSIEVKNS